MTQQITREDLEHHCPELVAQIRLEGFIEACLRARFVTQAAPVPDAIDAAGVARFGSDCAAAVHAAWRPDRNALIAYLDADERTAGATAVMQVLAAHRERLAASAPQLSTNH